MAIPGEQHGLAWVWQTSMAADLPEAIVGGRFHAIALKHNGNFVTA